MTHLSLVGGGRGRISGGYARDGGFSGGRASRADVISFDIINMIEMFFGYGTTWFCCGLDWSMGDWVRHRGST
jgi:hypothetical protein